MSFALWDILNDILLHAPNFNVSKGLNMQVAHEKSNLFQIIHFYESRFSNIGNLVNFEDDFTIVEVSFGKTL